MFSKKIIWLALLSVYPLWAEPSFAKSSVKSHGKAISTEHFVPAQDEPFSSRSDIKAAKTDDDGRAVEPAIVKPESVSKPVQADAEQIKVFLSPASAPVVTTVSELAPVAAKPINQATEVVKPVPPVRMVQSISPVQTLPIVPAQNAGLIAPSALETKTTEQTGGPLRINPKPSSQELQDREQYWQHRGRGDLAANVREQINSLEPVKVRDAVTPLAVPAVKDTPRVIERMVQVEVVKPVAQKPVAQKPVEQKPVVLKSVEQKPAMGTVLPTVQKTVPVKTEAPVSTSNPASTFVPVPASTSVSAPAPVRVATPVASLAPVPAVALTSLVVPVARSVQAVDSAENGIGFVSANPTRQELDERAKYWEARGRTDLSTRGQNQVKLAEAKPVVSVRSVVPVAAPVERVRTVPRTIAAEAEPVGLDTAKVTSQELDDGAQYWEARGRVDLASQLRQKLQAMEPRHAVVARNTPQTALPDLEKTKNNQSVAKSVLEEALLKNPSSTQARLDLAQIYQGAGEFNKARGLIDGVLAGNPDLPVALYASAQLYAEQRLWRETLYALEKISPVSRSDEMGKLQKTAWAHVQIDRAEALVHQGNNREAEVLLRQVAVELAVNDTRRAQPETPALWTSVTKQKAKRRSRFSGQ